MSMLDRVNWKDLETRAFVHIPGFLTAPELEACRADYDSQPVDSGNRNYAMSGASEQALRPVSSRFEEVLAIVSARTSLKVDMVIGGTYFATKRGIAFAWHQDHESFFLYQNHYDYLNFYLPIVKPVKEKSNLTVVPFDAFERESPRAFRRVVRAGASWTAAIGDQQFLVLDNSGGMVRLNSSLERISETPLLEAGDLLLIRGDVFHRTQDNETERVALSVRATNSKTVIRRSTLANGGIKKAEMMAMNSDRYQRAFRAFAEAGRSTLSLAEFEAALSRLTAQGWTDPRRFRNQLLFEKARSGVLFSSVRKAANETLGRLAVSTYYSRQAKRASRMAQAARASGAT